MKSVGFIGQIDNNGFILSVAKLVSAFDNKVLVIDATSTQKSRYNTPNMFNVSRLDQTIVLFDNIDIAIGFNNILEIKKYKLTKGEDFNDYDFVFIYTDREEMCEEFDIKNANQLFFMATFDHFDLYRGVELLKFVTATKRRENTEARLSVNKVVSYTQKNTPATTLVNNLTNELEVNWQGVDIIPSYDEGDLSVYIQNQYDNKIDFKLLSVQTKDAITEASIRIMDESKDRVKKAIKNIEKNTSFMVRR
ncbi:MAG: hypothetical protein IKR04_07045 [Clostridia bacterium]|nr:hypothetical protein [Clostridia bacterium]